MKWRDMEVLLTEYYETGTSKEGGDAYRALDVADGVAVAEMWLYPDLPKALTS